MKPFQRGLGSLHAVICAVGSNEAENGGFIFKAWAVLQKTMIKIIGIR